MRLPARNDPLSQGRPKGYFGVERSALTHRSFFDPQDARGLSLSEGVIIIRLREAEETTPAEWWKERHKKRHMVVNRYEMERKKLPHRWAGHVARADTDTEASRALRTRGYNGGEVHTQHTRHNRDGVHPKRSSCWRREAQITVIKEYKDAKTKQHKRPCRMATNSTEQRNMERNRTRIRKRQQQLGK